MGRSWAEIPLPLRLFALLLVLQVPRLVVLSPGHAGLVAFVIGFSLLIAVLALRGSRAVWVFLVGAEAVGLLLAPLTGLGPWWSVILGLGETALLVWPSSFRFVWRERSSAVARTARERATPQSELNPDRPDGWYVDPENPSRMNYWRSESADWVGSAKTPRKIRQEWEARS